TISGHEYYDPTVRERTNSTDVFDTARCPIPYRFAESRLVGEFLSCYGHILSLTLAYSCGVSECIFHSVPDMARNFYTVSARPGHERNLIVPDFAAHGRDRVAEGQDRFWIPCSGSRLELS